MTTARRDDLPRRRLPHRLVEDFTETVVGGRMHDDVFGQGGRVGHYVGRFGERARW